VTRVAAVDLGTNTTRLLVADVEDERIETVVQRLRVTRLGEGVDERRRLLPLPIARVRNCLSDYRRELESLGAERTLLVATSAVRDAENGEAFLGEIEWSYGFATRLLSGDEEAASTFRGATHDREPLETLLVLDVGGGSTEVIVGTNGAISFRTSLDAGSVRMTERFLHSDPPSARELEDCAASVRALLAERLPDDLQVDRAVGVAGTVTTIAALDLGLAVYDRFRVHGHRLRPEDVVVQLERLASLPIEQRRAVPALDPDRAPVIVAGAVILREAMDHLGLGALEASEHDLLYGAALEAAALPGQVERDAPPGAFTCC
jgi:exopolyphosphatase / guanosine-5'-triphosphate,3'-diphosphate pyrophosphatase